MEIYLDQQRANIPLLLLEVNHSTGEQITSPVMKTPVECAFYHQGSQRLEVATLEVTQSHQNLQRLEI